MRIAFIVSTFPKISETFILNQITGLIDLGHEVEIFAEYSKTEKVHPDVEKYRLMDRLHYYTTPDNRVWRLIKGLCVAGRKFASHPSDVLNSLNFLRFGTKALSLKVLYIAAPFLGRKFDIVHSHFATNGALGIFLKELGMGGKYVTTFHGYDVNSTPFKSGNDIYRHLFRKCDLFTANTNFTKKQAERLGCDEKKIKVLPVGFKVDRFRFNIRLSRPGETTRLLTIGRLVEKKGHEYALRAVAMALKKHGNILYTIAGGGPLKDRLQKLTSELGIGRHVRFIDEVNEEEARELYYDSHIFLLPSVTAEDRDREGQALVLQEAQATGMPVISTYHNGIPEGMLNCRSGFLVPEKKAEAIAGKIVFLMEHPDLWPEMGWNGRRFVLEKYDIDRLNKRLVGIYERLIENKKADG